MKSLSIVDLYQGLWKFTKMTYGYFLF